MFCSKCGKEISENDKYCPNCGAEINLSYNVKEPVTYSPKSKTTAALFAIILGNYGAHNFYLGHTKMALMQFIPTCVLVLLDALFFTLGFTKVLDIEICRYMSHFFEVFRGLIAIWSLTEFILILCNKMDDSKGLPLRK